MHSVKGEVMQNVYNRKMAEQAARRRKLILTLSLKMTNREIGAKLGISPQRVNQLLQIARLENDTAKV